MTLHDRLDLLDFLSVNMLSELALATVWSLAVFVSAGAATSGVSAGELDVDIKQVVYTNLTCVHLLVPTTLGLN